ncbi:hypothetical protein ACQ4PT_015217 [Festuca glaucescens]
MTSMPRARLLACIAVAALATPPWWGVAAHTRGVRPGESAGQPFPENATRAEEAERLFMRWVRYVGALEHSTFQHAVARAFPSYSLVVDRNPASGDFTSIQAAVDSLPPINLVRVVIRVNAGTYTIATCTRSRGTTAQNRQSMLEDTGFSFLNCRVTGSGALYLGRAWGTFSRVVFAYTYMDDIIVPRGWYNWGDPNRELTVFYGQYKCTGPGASYSGRVSWSRELTDQEAKPFISLSFIDGTEWIRI